MTKNKNRAIRLLGILYLVLSSNPLFADQIIIDSDRQFEFARTCMEMEKYEIAVAEFERFIHFFPEDSRAQTARRLIGICFLKNHRYESARDAFFDGLHLNPSASEAEKNQLLIGESYYIQEITSEAQRWFEELSTKSSDPNIKNAALYRLGWTRMQGGKWQDASVAFNGVEENSIFFESALELSEQSLLGEDLPYKTPAYAGTLAAVLPGLGHAYVSRYKDATVAFLLNGLFIWAAAESFHQDHGVLGGILTAFEVGWYSGNIYSAVNCAHKYNRHMQQGFRKSLKDQFDLQFLAAPKRSVGLFIAFKF